jgi:hypothetical protein
MVRHRRGNIFAWKFTFVSELEAPTQLKIHREIFTVGYFDFEKFPPETVKLKISKKIGI